MDHFGLNGFNNSPVLRFTSYLSKCFDEVSAVYIWFLFSAQALVLLIKSSDGGYLSTSNQGIYTVRPEAPAVTLPVVFQRDKY